MTSDQEFIALCRYLSAQELAHKLKTPIEMVKERRHNLTWKAMKELIEDMNGTDNAPRRTQNALESTISV